MKPIGHLSEEGLRQRQWYPSKLAIGCRIRDRHEVLLGSAGEALLATSVMLNQCIGDELDQDRKGQDLGIGTASVPLVEIFKKGGLGNVRKGQDHRLRKR